MKRTGVVDHRCRHRRRPAEAAATDRSSANRRPRAARIGPQQGRVRAAKCVNKNIKKKQKIFNFFEYTTFVLCIVVVTW